MVLYIFLSYAYKKLNLFKKTTLLMLFAIQIEVVQYFIPNRYFSLFDVVADAIGIFIGYLFVKIISKKIKYNNN